MNNGYTAEGYLKVRVTEVNGTIPIENAVVTISDYTSDPKTDSGAGDVLFSLRTNPGGMTETVTLMTPPTAESASPGAYQPYAVYNVTVEYPGYYSVIGVGVPVFPGVIAVQPVNLTPISEEGILSGEIGRRIMIFETPDSQSLQPGGVKREDIGNKNGSLSGSMMQNAENSTRTGQYNQQNQKTDLPHFNPDNTNLTDNGGSI